MTGSLCLSWSCISKAALHSFNSMEVTAREALWAFLVTGGLLGVPF